jgi:uncharacterized cofD-like protein
MRKITTVGGGTGTFVVLSGLKKKPDVELSAIVSVADDGGSTGRLRDAYGYLPAGDLRQALVALSEDETMLRKLFMHRFSKGELSGHNFGNLYLVALTEMLGSDIHAIEEAARILRIKGKVIPVSESPAVLCAEYDGRCVEGQTVIQNNPEQGRVTRLYLKNVCDASSAACAALQESNMVILGPGDIYTSTLANFVTNGLSESLAQSPARFVYVMNLFSTPESGSMTMRDYVTAVEQYVGRSPDVVIVNSAEPLPEAVEHYAARGQFLVADDLGDDARVLRTDVLSNLIIDKHQLDVIQRSLIRHDADKLAEVILSL